MSLGKFTSKLKAFELKTIPEKVEALSKKVADSALTRLVERTPVREGIARNNWNVKINSIDKSVNLSPQIKGGGKPLTSLPPISLTGSKAVSRGEGVIDTMKAGDTIFITNAVDYIKDLDSGASKQTPSILGITVQNLKLEFGSL